MHTTLAKPSPEFSWSFSRLKSFEDCPRRFHETQIKKAWGEERSEALSYGDAVHEAMAAALRSNTPLPAQYVLFQNWVDKILRTPGELLVECSWALTADFQPTVWRSNKAWLRAKVDAAKINDDVALIVDHKTGKSLNADNVQLTLMSLMAFCHFPKLRKVRADFIWLTEDSQTTQVLDRSEVADAWAEILPRVERLQRATIDQEFPPLPGRYCRSWCKVSSCEYHGK